MPDVKEVFEMVTKQAPPTPDAFERQLREQRRAVRNRKAGAFALVASLLLVAIVAYAVLRDVGEKAPIVDDPSAPPTQPTDVFFDLSTGEATPLPKSIAGPEYDGAAFAVSPDGTMLVFESVDPDDPFLYVSNIDGTDERRLSPGFDGDHFGFAPQWSPDGTEIVYASGDSINNGSVKILVADVLTGEVRVAAEAPRSLRQVFRLPSFIPGGQTILVTTSGSGGLADGTTALATIPAEGGQPTTLLEEAAYGTSSPDGTTIAYLTIAPGTEEVVLTLPDLWLANEDGSDPRLLVVSPDENPSDDVPFEWRPVWSPDGTRIAYERSTGEVAIVQIATGEVTVIGEGQRPTWVDDDTLIIEGYLEA